MKRLLVFAAGPERRRSEVLPELKDIQKVSRAIAFAVGKMAQQQGVAVKTSAEALQQAIDDNFWQAEYRDYRRTSI